MPYGKKAKEMREAFKRMKNKEKTRPLSDYINELTKDVTKESPKSNAIIFDASNDPEEMCNPNTITTSKVDMNKLRSMKR